MGGGSSIPRSKNVPTVIVTSTKEASQTAPSSLKRHVSPVSQSKSSLATHRGALLRNQLTEAQRKDLTEVLGVARASKLNGKALADFCRFQFDEFCAGSEVVDPSLWQDGPNLVLSGKASVVININNTPVTVCVLLRGDSFGWQCFDEDPEVPEVDQWLRLRPRVVVGAGAAPLRICLLEEEDVEGASNDFGRNNISRLFSKRSVTGIRSEALGAKREGLGTCVSLFCSIWLTTTPTAEGVCCTESQGVLRAHFLAGLWGPLLERFQALQDEIRRRERRGFRVHDRFPLQGNQIEKLKCQVRQFTAIWYGSARGGNLSAFFRWFMKALEINGITAYSMENIPVTRSLDGWVTIVDGVARSNALKGKSGQNASFVAAGGLDQKQGRSAIDNTVLCNLFTRREAREQFVGRRIRKAIAKFMGIRQLCILRKLSTHLMLDVESLAADGVGHGRRTVRSIMRSFNASQLEAVGVTPDGPSFHNLVLRGEILFGWGQLELKTQEAVWKQIRQLIRDYDGYHEEESTDKSPDIFHNFVAFCRDRPGEFFENNRLRHFEVQFAGLISGEIVLIRRSTMERFTLSRYISMSWRRSQPLWAVFSGHPHQARLAGTNEASFVRVNECPYALFHGMSLASGGYAADETDMPRTSAGVDKKQDNRYSFLMEFQWIRDPAANIENWFLTDIEKILNEVWLLNPRGPERDFLPGEMMVEVGQNPKVGSSIKQTQHTQMSEGSLASHPLLLLDSATGPRYSEYLGGTIDFVDVGGPLDAAPELRGFFMKVQTARPTAPYLVGFMVDLRLHLLKQFGGSEQMDFFCNAMSDGAGGFVIVFAPLAQLEKVDDKPPDFATFANPLTGESSESAGLQESRIDFGKGVGHFLCAKPELREQLMHGGEETLRRIWAFNRVSGAQAAAERFAAERGVFG
mmetsp:Transcript_88179/g.169800  ORF Transcript_88179/g.169800 Transcript_88179/m.169800 type:complete len:917 (-) Transcript_88179:190-2940(-)